MIIHAFSHYQGKEGCYLPFRTRRGGEEKAQQDFQLAELEKSLAYCRHSLGMGRKAA